MAKKFFNFMDNNKKKYMNTKLPNGQVLQVMAPTKRILKDITDAQTADDLYNVCADILSRNKGNIRVSVDDLEKIMDYEDLVEFIRIYAEFIKDIANTKN